MMINGGENTRLDGKDIAERRSSLFGHNGHLPFVTTCHKLITILSGVHAVLGCVYLSRNPGPCRAWILHNKP